jgi:hypothetical protein
MKTRILRCTTLFVLLGSVGLARGDVVYTLNADSKGNSATALFSTVTLNGNTYIEVTVTNTENTNNNSHTNTGDVASAIGQVQFTIGGTGLSLPTSFDQLSGSKITYSAQNTPGVVTGPFTYNPPSSDPNLRWGFSTSGTNTVNLVDIDGGGLTGPGGSPVDELIVAANAIPTSNSPISHSPLFNGSASFFLKVASAPTDLQLSNILGVKFSFGTGPEDLLATGATGQHVPPGGNSGQDVVAPEPSTLATAALGAVFALGYRWRVRRRATARELNRLDSEVFHRRRARTG